MTSAHEKAEAFRALHRGEKPLLLFNAWDVPSARAIARVSPAIATSSGAAAAALGYGDGEQHPLESVIGFVRRICAAVQVPVSVDFEAGYADTPEGAALAVSKILAAGAIGINLEDGLVKGKRRLAAAESHAAKIRAIREVAGQLSVPLFINARTDAFLLTPNEPRAALAETIARAAIYEEAGADGLFAPGLTDVSMIAELAASTPLPVNIMAVEGIAPVEELARVGTKRISCGAWPMMEAMRFTSRAAAQFVLEGVYPSAKAPPQ